MAVKACACEIGQWEWWWPLSGNPQIYCDVCGTVYDWQAVLEELYSTMQETPASRQDNSDWKSD